MPAPALHGELMVRPSEHGVEGARRHADRCIAGVEAGGDVEFGGLPGGDALRAEFGEAAGVAGHGKSLARGESGELMLAMAIARRPRKN